MRRLLIVLAACHFQSGTVPEPSGDAKLADASIDAPIDAKMSDRVCPTAPPGCTLFKCSVSTSCYYVCGNNSSLKFSWTGAVASCAGSGLGCIVTINSQGEQDCITTATTPTYQSFVWIGFFQNPLGGEPDQGWSWQCGNSSYVHPTWGMYEPNNDGDEDCAAMTDGGGWFDAVCSGTARMVCELP